MLTRRIPRSKIFLIDMRDVAIVTKLIMSSLDTRLMIKDEISTMKIFVTSNAEISMEN